MFARELEKNFLVWWYNDNGYPDVGTQELNIFEQDEIIS
jgi:hypothetical protein